MNGCSHFFHQKDENEVVKMLTDYEKSLGEMQKNISDASISKFIDISNKYAHYACYNQAALIFRIGDKVILEEDRTYNYYSHSGLMYYEMGEYTMAVERYKKAIEKASNEFRYYNNLAILSLANQEFDACRKYVTKALEINPGYPRSHYILSFCYMKPGEYPQSLQLIRQCLELRPKTFFYQVKHFCVMIIGFPLDLGQVRGKLAHILQMAEEGEDDDGIMLKAFYKPFVRRITRFLVKFFAQDISEIDQDIRLFVEHLDKFLLMGNCEKYRLARKMEKILVKSWERYFPSEVMADILKEEAFPPLS